jgi:tetratricopeptide (TPR) repeat protein
LEGIWELGRDSARKQAIRSTFVATGRVGAARAFTGVTGLLDQYLTAWTSTYRDACEATHVRGEQSTEVLDLRMACLGQRLAGVRALTDILSTADGSVVDNAVSAVGSLPSLEGCSDVATLKSVIQPPRDQKTLQRVEEARGQIARARALSDAGQCVQALAASRTAVASADAVGYLPVRAEALFVDGRTGDFCADASAAIPSLEEAVWAAEASHHDEVIVNAAGTAAVMYADRMHDARAGRRWIRHARAVLARLSSHPVLEAFTATDEAVVYLAEGKTAEAAREAQRALTLKEQVFGPMHPDTAISAMNLGDELHELGRADEAEPFARRAVVAFESLLGPDSSQLAMALVNQAEDLTALGSHAAARAALTRAIAIWRRAGASPFLIAFAEADLARVALAEKKAGEAVALLEGAVEILAKQDQIRGAEARFTLARALWERAATHARAVQQARAARKDLVAGAAPAAKLAEVDAWLQQHAGT